MSCQNTQGSLSPTIVSTFKTEAPFSCRNSWNASTAIPAPRRSAKAAAKEILQVECSFNFLWACSPYAHSTGNRTKKSVSEKTKRIVVIEKITVATMVPTLRNKSKSQQPVGGAFPTILAETADIALRKPTRVRTPAKSDKPFKLSHLLLRMINVSFELLVANLFSHIVNSPFKEKAINNEKSKSTISCS